MWKVKGFAYVKGMMFPKRVLAGNAIFSRVLRYSTPRYVGASVGWLVGWSPFWAAAPKGSMTYAFTHMGNILLLLHLLLLRTPPSPQPPGPYLSLEAHIPAWRPKSQS